MTPDTPDNVRSTPTGRPARDAGDSESIARLEQALAAEIRVSAALRSGLDELRAKVERLEEGFNERLEAATRRSKTAETKLADQQQRLAALGTGREDTMRRLADTRAELARVRAERDALLKKLDSDDEMQTATVALTEDQVDEPTMHPLPSMDDLMAALDKLAGEGDRSPLEGGGHSHAQVSLDEGPSREMIAPELVFADEDEEHAENDERASAADAGLPTSRVLVFLDGAQPIKYPLYKAVMTIGRSDKADIHVEGDFISRVHARLLSTVDGVVVEDIASKNGIKVNSKQTERQILHHGDVIGIGKVHFTFIDTNRTAE